MKNVTLLAVAFLMATHVFGQTIQDAQRELDNESYFKAKQILFKLLNDGVSNKAEAAYYLGNAYLKSDDADSAKLFYKMVFEIDPKAPMGYVARGRIMLLQKNAIDAKTNFDLALKFSKFKNANIYLEIGDAYFKPNIIDLAAAISNLKSAQELDPKSTSIMLDLGDAYLENSVNDPQGGGLAMNQYQNARDVNKNLSIAYIKEGRLDVRGQIYDDAIKSFDKALKIDENYPIVHMELGDVYFLTKQFDKTIVEFKKYVDLSPGDTKAKTKYLEMLMRNKAYDKVAEEANKALKNEPNNVDFLRYLIYSDVELKRYQEGSDASNRFFAIPNVKPKPRDIMSAARLAAAVNDTTRAFNYFRTAIISDSTNCDLLSEFAKVLYGAKHYQEAVDQYQSKKVKCGDLKTIEFYYLGRAYLLLNDSINADTSFATFISKSPTTPDGYYWRARTNLKIGKFEDYNSLPYYQKYIELAEPNAVKFKENLIEAYQYLGVYYISKLKDKEKAKLYLNKALELDPNNQDTIDFLKQIK